MNSKIAGFILAKEKKNYLPKLNSNIKIKDIELPYGHLSLYFYGDIAACEISSNRYSLGFPATDDLLDYNLIISINNDSVTIENDWLGAIPVFYNSKERVISSFPKICLTNQKEMDEEGLFYYLKYGFCIFEKTPFKNINFLPFYSTTTFSSQGISVQQKEDPLNKIDQFKNCSEEEIWSDIAQYQKTREEKIDGSIIIPTSAGLDSRILNYFAYNKSRVKTFSYGISKNQSKSFEVINAQKVAKQLGVDWQQLPLDNAFDYYGDWHDLFSYSTHLHGMIHIEFYKKIEALFPGESLSMMSGICGGVFCGSNNYALVNTPEALYQLAFTHNANYSPDAPIDNNTKERDYLKRYQYLFSDIRFYPIITMRLKMMVLSYLMTIPSVMGIPAWTPFLNFKIVMKMLNLPENRRNNRNWVNDFFQQKGLAPKKNLLFQDTKNRLNIHLHKNYHYDPIDFDFHSKLINPRRVDEANAILKDLSFKTKLNHTLTTTRVVKEVLKKMNISNTFIKKLTDYQTLKALEMAIKNQ